MGMQTIENNSSADQEPIVLETIKQLNAGSQKAFDAVYHAYYVYLCSIAIYYVHDRDAASGIVNDVFLSLWEHREDVYPPILAYLRQAVKNAAVSHLRSHMYRSGTLLETDGKLWDYVSNTVTAADDPLAMLNHKELRQRVLDEVEQLPPRCRAIFKACMYEGLDYKEISHREQLSVSTVRVQIKIAVDKLRQRLSMPLWLIVLLLH
jgi:RNA polymerase sigma-70 factor (family 1)